MLIDGTINVILPSINVMLCYDIQGRIQERSNAGEFRTFSKKLPNFSNRFRPYPVEKHPNSLEARATSPVNVNHSFKLQSLFVYLKEKTRFLTSCSLASCVIASR